VTFESQEINAGTYDFVLRVEYPVLGTSATSEVGALHTVVSDLLQPSLKFTTPVRTVLSSEKVNLDVEATLPDCIAKEVPGDLLLTYTWTYHKIGDPVDAFVPVPAEWLLASTRGLRIPGNTLPVRCQIPVRVFTFVQSAPQYNNTAVAHVNVDKAKLEPRISGGTLRRVSSDLLFTVDGSSSFDPNQLIPPADLPYQWRCHAFETQYEAEDAALPGLSCTDFPSMLTIDKEELEAQLVSPVLTVNPAWFRPEISQYPYFRFVLVLPASSTDTNCAGEESVLVFDDRSEMQVVHVTGRVIDVGIGIQRSTQFTGDTTFVGDNSLVNPNDKLKLVGRVTLPGAYDAQRVLVRWQQDGMYVSNNPEKFLTPGDTEIDVQPGVPVDVFLVLASNSLAPSREYTFNLQVGEVPKLTEFLFFCETRSYCTDDISY
jgi:hypothetical protein